MPTVHHEDHILWKPRVMPRRTFAMYVACVALAIALVAIGWVFTLKSVMADNFTQAKTEFSSASDALKGVQQATARTPTTPLQDIKTQFQQVLDPYLAQAEERKDLLDATVEATKKQLEEQGYEQTEQAPE